MSNRPDENREFPVLVKRFGKVVLLMLKAIVFLAFGLLVFEGIPALIIFSGFKLGEWFNI